MPTRLERAERIWWQRLKVKRELTVFPIDCCGGGETLIAQAQLEQDYMLMKDSSTRPKLVIVDVGCHRRQGAGRRASKQRSLICGSGGDQALLGVGAGGWTYET